MQQENAYSKGCKVTSLEDATISSLLILQVISKLLNLTPYLPYNLNAATL